VLSSEATVRPSLILLPAAGKCTTSSPNETAELVSISNFAALSTSAIAAACAALIEGEPKLTEWDTIVGDGDCGITMLRGAKEVKKRLEEGNLSVECPSKLFSELADAVSAVMGGTSGILFELMLRKMSRSLMDAQKRGSAVDEAALCMSFAAGVQAGSFYGGARIGYRTMMDALLPAADVSQEGFGAIANAASAGADSTIEMNVARAGRSSYLSEETLSNTPDPGAKAVAFILAAASKAVQ